MLTGLDIDGRPARYKLSTINCFCPAILRIPIPIAGPFLAKVVVREASDYSSSFLKTNFTILRLLTTRITPITVWTPAAIAEAKERITPMSPSRPKEEYEKKKAMPEAKSGIVFKQTESPHILTNTFANCFGFIEVFNTTSLFNSSLFRIPNLY